MYRAVVIANEMLRNKKLSLEKLKMMIFILNQEYKKVFKKDLVVDELYVYRSGRVRIGEMDTQFKYRDLYMSGGRFDTKEYKKDLDGFEREVIRRFVRELSGLNEKELRQKVKEY